MTRETELAANLEVVRERISSACEAVGRHPDEITLVVVTKFFPASDVQILAGLGVADVAENRHQEAAAKAEECADLGLRWHFVGGLQSNKAAAVAAYCDVVESIDRAKLIGGLQRGAADREGSLDCLLQVSLDPTGPTVTTAPTGRSGAAAPDLARLAAAVTQAPDLELCGLMAVAPLGEDPVPAFARLTDIRAEFLSHHPQATRLSAGMSADLESAITAGATHVRIGSAVLGRRPSIQ